MRLRWVVSFLWVLTVSQWGWAIDTNDVRQVAANRILQMPFAEAMDLVPKQQPLISSTGVAWWSWSAPKIYWIDDQVRKELQTEQDAAKCPNCGQSKMNWNLDRPDEITCDNCASVLPRDFPDNRTETYTTWGGDTHWPQYPEKSVDISFYEDSQGDRYFTRGIVESFKNNYTYKMIQDCAYTYEKTGEDAFAKMAADLWVQYALNKENFVCINGGKYASYIDQAGNGLTAVNHNSPHPPGSASQKIWGEPLEMDTFKTIRDSDVFAQQGRVDNRSYKEYITEELFRWEHRFRASTTSLYFHLGNLGLASDANRYKIFGFPETAHWIKRFVEVNARNYCVTYDGMSIEGSGYHTQWMWRFDDAYGITGHVDPPGYVDPIDGTRIDSPLLIGDAFRDSMRWIGIRNSFEEIRDVDGGTSLIHDTGAYMKNIGTQRTEGRSHILPGFGHVVMADGLGADQQHQTQLHYSRKYAGHDHWDSLHAQFAFFGRVVLQYPGHENYFRSTINKNTVVVDRKDQAGDIEGNLVYALRSTPGLQAVSVSCDNIGFRSGASVDPYKRSQFLNTIDLDHPYCLDIFEAKGGKVHEYILNGSMFHKQSMTANVAVTPSSDQDSWSDYKDMQAGTIQAGSYVDLTFDSPDGRKTSSDGGPYGHMHEDGVGARIHMGHQAGDTLYLGSCDTHYGGPRGAVTNRLSMIIRRGDVAGASGLDSTFVNVIEGFKQHSPAITDVRTHDLGNGALAIEVELPDRIDTYLFSKNGPKQMAFGEFSTDGVFATFSHSKVNSNSDAWMLGGTYAQSSRKSVVADSGVLEGQLLDTNSTFWGDDRDAILVSLDLPLGGELAGQLLVIEGFGSNGSKRFSNPQEIDFIEAGPQAGTVWVYVRDEPGIEALAGGGLRETVWPKDSCDSHKVLLYRATTSVPHIADIRPSRYRWFPEYMEWFEACGFDKELHPDVSVLPAGSDVRYTLDGSMPDAQSRHFRPSFKLTDDATMQFRALNPDGVVQDRAYEQRYYKRRVALKGTPSGSGLRTRYSSGAEYVSPWVPYSAYESVDHSKGSEKGLYGYITVPTAGYYEFGSRFASGATLTIGGEEVIDQRSVIYHDYRHGIWLEAGTHTIDVQFGGLSKASYLKWKPVGGDWGLIPASVLSPDFIPDPPSGSTHTLTYAAQANGSIQGSTNQTVVVGEDATVVYAQADEGYVFDGWSDGVNIPQRLDRDVQADQSVTATFRAVTASEGYLVERWDSIGGSYVSALTSHADFPHNPSSTSRVSRLSLDNPSGDSWGIKVSGMIRAPISGDYTFRIASDDTSELWLGTDATEGSKQKIAECTSWVNPGSYSRSGQTSAMVALEAGKAYYVEVLLKEGGGFAFMDTQWKLPNTSEFFSIGAFESTDNPNPVSLNQNAFKWRLSYWANSHEGHITGATDQLVADGGNATTVTAIPASGYTFARWSDGNTNATRTDTNVDQDASLEAIFMSNTATLSYTAGSHGLIAGDTQQEVPTGDQGAEVKAIPEAGYQFVAWSDGLTAATRSDVATAGGLSVTASFTADVTPPVIDSLNGPQSAVEWGMEVNFSVTAHDAANPATQPNAAWDLDGDGEYDDATGWNVSYVYPVEMTGLFDVSVRVTDFAGNASTANYPVEVRAYAGVYLSDMNWVSATIGWGSIHRDASVTGADLSLGGTPYRKGIGTHADSTIVYDLDGKYVTFESVVGINDNASGSATFIVYLDGVEAYRSSELTRSTGPEEISLDVTGVQELKLEVDGGSSTSSDHAVWAMARVLLGGVDAAPPVISALTVPPRVGFKETFTASVTATDDATDANALVIAWDLDGDGQFDDAQGSVVQWSYDVPTARTVAIGVEVRDGVGRTTTKHAVINITPPTYIYLTDMEWESAKSGWSSVQKDTAVSGSTLKLNGVTYDRGLGTHGESTIIYHLNGSFDSFAVDIGLDDAEKGRSKGAVFAVYLDDILLYRSEDLYTDSPAQSLLLGVRGGNELRLEVEKGADGGSSWDHANWADARVYPTVNSDTQAPVITAMTPTTADVGQMVSLAVQAYDNVSIPKHFLVEWDLDQDGTYDEVGLNITHQFATAGNTTVGVRVTDEANNSITSNTTIQVHSTTALPPVPTDMLAHWKLDETTGTTATDEMGNFDGTLVGGTLINQSGVVDNAYGLDGIDSAVDVTSLDLNTNAMTVTAWVNLAEAQAGSASIFMWRGGSTRSAGLNLRDTRELMYHWNGGGKWGWHSGLYVPANQWVLVAWAVEANQTTLHMRDVGALQSSVNMATNAVLAFDGSAFLGRDSGYSTRYMDGLLDDVRLYKRTLSADEIEAMYQEVMQGRLALSATAGPGGSISPSSQVVSPNASQTFTITPDAGYEIFDVLVDGSSVGAQSSYRFNNVTRHHFIDARFQKLPSTTNWTITATAGTGGTITPNGAQAVPEGNLHVVNITPNAGYRILDVTVDGQSVGARASYAFSQVAQAHSIQAIFEATTQWALTASVQGGNGSVTPVSASVYDGGAQTFTFTPASGYQVADVLVDGASFGASGAYSLANITTNHTIVVSFEKAPVRVLDSDGDGWSDALETTLGTDPYDLDSFFKIIRITPRSATGKVELTWPSASGVQYRVLTSPDLSTWSEARSWSTATAIPEELYELNQSPSNSFFKVEAQLP